MTGYRARMLFGWAMFAVWTVVIEQRPAWEIAVLAATLAALIVLTRLLGRVHVG
ncbi:hypothetical protein AB0H76_15210 [Nocardia sp. NPDC050712]|uniref:hypothetical protein n=1 Tax=Nocardia sp. NPDC050712 TaxID=3155518 RepID=UPI003406381B